MLCGQISVSISTYSQLRHAYLIVVEVKHVIKVTGSPLVCNIEIEVEAILSVQVVSQLNLDYYTNVSQGGSTVSY